MKLSPSYYNQQLYKKWTVLPIELNVFSDMELFQKIWEGRFWHMVIVMDYIMHDILNPSLSLRLIINNPLLHWSFYVSG